MARLGEQSAQASLGQDVGEPGPGAVFAVVPQFADRYAEGANWRALVWRFHSCLPYSRLVFFAKLAAFTISWHERPKRTICSYTAPRDLLAKPGKPNHTGNHRDHYRGFPALRTTTIS
ncbi:MAG: hypothetical protein QF742_08990 [Alphaproteobacteria bacterium]|nr:hypothetical protein [Alphaproteobacteria bacterium]